MTISFVVFSSPGVSLTRQLCPSGQVLPPECVIPSAKTGIEKTNNNNKDKVTILIFIFFGLLYFLFEFQRQFKQSLKIILASFLAKNFYGY